MDLGILLPRTIDRAWIVGSYAAFNEFEQEVNNETIDWGTWTIDCPSALVVNSACCSASETFSIRLEKKQR